MGELVQVVASDGARLDGLWEQPARAGASRLGVDAVIMNHGVAGNFYSTHLFNEMSQWLLDEGCAALRVNNRGHDFVSRLPTQGDRGILGAAYEEVDDCRLDWRAWIEFARAAGMERIAVWGHSLGAVKSIYYMAKERDSDVKAVVAISPPRLSHSAYRGTEEWPEFEALYLQAKRHVDEGNPEMLMALTRPLALVLAAKTVVEKYGPEERFNIMRYIPDVPVPLLLTIGSKEGVEVGYTGSRISFAGLAADIEKLSGELEHLTFASVEEADHMYTGRVKELWGVIRPWLQQV